MEEMKYVVEVDVETFKGIVNSIAGSGWKPEPVKPLSSGDARRRLAVGNVTFVENTPRPVKINIVVEGCND